MKRIVTMVLSGVALFTVAAYENSAADTLPEKSAATLASQRAEQPLEFKADLLSATDLNPTTVPVSSFKTIEWTALMPKEDIDALLNPPAYITDIEDGSFEDQISNQIQNSLAAATDDRYQQALASTRIIPEMDGEAIRIPGFIVPLEFDDEQVITEFFLVPFFGACIHVPPPPPNQIIYINYPKGIKLDALHEPFWISGVVKTSLVENEMATSAYSLQMQAFEVYVE